MIVQKIRPWLTRLYPRAWRARYGVEFNALLEQCLHSPLDVVDVFLGALDAHLQVLNEENVNWRSMNKMNKLRTSLLIVFAAFIGFVIAGFSLVGLADDSPMIPLMQSNLPLYISWILIQVGALVALLAIVIGGLPLGSTLIRRAFTTHRRSLALLFVPVGAFLVLLAYLAFIFLVSTGRIVLPGVIQMVQPGVFPAGNRWLMAGLMIVFILGAIASTWAVWKVVSDTDVEQQTFRPNGRPLTLNIYRFAFVPAVIAAFAMLLMFVSTIAWGWISFTALPQVFSGNFGPWLTNTQAWYFGILTLMLLCTLAAFYALARNRKAATQA